jgi:hypothetical protein
MLHFEKKVFQNLVSGISSKSFNFHQWRSQDQKSHVINSAFYNFDVIFIKFFIFSQYFKMDLVKFSCDISYMKIHVATPLTSGIVKCLQNYIFLNI